MDFSPIHFLKLIIAYAKASPAYLTATWETVEYFYEPKLAAMAGGLVVVCLLLRVFIGGIIGFLIRTAIYGAVFYMILINQEFRALYPHPVVAGVIDAIAVLAVAVPVALLGGVVRALLGRGRQRSEPAAAMPAPAAGGGQPFNVARADGDKKQIMVIMMTDIQGYSARMEKNEAATYELLKDHNVIMRKAITTNHGKEIKTIGDAFMVVFKSPIDALRCGIAMQNELHAFNKPRPVNDQLKVRIGIHQGEVIATAKDVFGEGVNIAARMESITEPGGISISAEVYEAVKGKVEAGFHSIGHPKMKNIASPPEVFRVHLTH